MSSQPGPGGRDLHLRPTATPSERTPKPAPRLSQVSPQLTGTYLSSPDGLDANLLMLFHGLGDTHVPFANLGKSLNLPQTAILSLRAPELIPLLEEGFQWVHSFDEMGEMITNPNPSKTISLLKRLLQHLTQDCGWPVGAIHFFGYAQGGSIAAETAPQLAEGALGSLVSVSGGLWSFPTPSSKCATPVLVWRRPSDQVAAGPFRQGFADVREHVAQGGQGQGMPRGKDEWWPVMKFWSEKLRRLQPWELAAAGQEQADVFEVTGRN